VLDILIRTPTGSVKINGSHFVPPVVAIEIWNAVAVQSMAVHISYLDLCLKDCSAYPYETGVRDCGNSFPWSSSKLSFALVWGIKSTLPTS